jgi:hypothetical protein
MDDIFHPNYGRKIAHVDGKSKINIKMKMKKGIMKNFE